MIEKLLTIPRQWLIAIALTALMGAVLILILSVRELSSQPDIVVEEGSAETLSTQGEFRPADFSGVPTPDPFPADWTPPLSDKCGTTHIVASGENLGSIALLYDYSLEEISAANRLANPNALAIGDSINIPGECALSDAITPSMKIVPDSELIYSPSALGFDINEFMNSYNGYLLQAEDVVDGEPINGIEAVQLVANRMSVNPRILLAALEYESGWVTNSAPEETQYPLGNATRGYEGLYKQLEWAANKLNFGYYGRSEGGLTQITIADAGDLYLSPDINDGTAGVQLYLASISLATEEQWLIDVGEDGILATYESLFGSPFSYTYEPITPSNLQQPQLSLPWARGETWYFTGGPHPAWAGGSAWAALDFVPSAELFGCYESDEWVTAVANGTVVRSERGQVVIDLDGDRFAGSGWAIHHLHIATNERIAAGTRVRAGDKIGHPSCEGGVSTGTHVHIMRSYNGRWISADGAIPFNLGGWVSEGSGDEYNGQLKKDGITKDAYIGREPFNAIENG